jgi:hypothetical protein
LFAAVLLGGLLPLAGAEGRQALVPTAPGGGPVGRVGYNRDVRPILAENCFGCHSADKAKRKGGVGLTNAEDARAAIKDSDRHAIVAGDLAKSQLAVRISTADQDDVMPPADSTKKLTAQQIAVLRAWVAQGGEYEQHWSYAPIQTPAAPVAAPTVAAKDWALGDIDRFILAQLEREGLPPAPEADRPTLLRRLSLDLTGLPPTPAEVDAFVADRAADAYAKVVERLLASPRYGERMAVFWLDLVRYADSIGYHSDNARNVAPYRDYVIAAFNADLPFDRFTIEQLAGDLLPKPTTAQRVASAYNRLLMTTEEGGAQAKEYEAKNLGDRVRNVAGAWLGSTLGCAECHDHKFDPFSTRDFYAMGAFFADVKENAIGRREDELVVLDDARRARLDQVEAALAPLRKQLDTDTPELQAAQRAWEVAAGGATAWAALAGLQGSAAKGSALTPQPDGSLLVARPADFDTFTLRGTTALTRLTGLRLEALPDPSLPQSGPGTADNGNFVLSTMSLAFAEDGGQGAVHPVALTAAAADHEQGDWPIAAVLAAKPGGGWAILPQTGKPHTASFACAPVAVPPGASVVVTLGFASPHARHLIGRPRVTLTGDAEPLREQGLPDEVRKALGEPADKRSPEQRQKLAAHYRGIAPALDAVRAQVAPLQKERQELEDAGARCLVTVSAPPRTVRVLPRGNWQDDSGAVMAPAVPHFLRQVPAPSAGQRATRLDLAQWLVAADNPLTARVFVNRVWRLLFGTGLSRTVDDLGVQGEWPVHPELLDHLAARFRAGWGVKALMREIVTSRTYRLAATPPADQRARLAERDPFGRLLSHQGTFRLDAEFVRDNALAISGLLAEQVGGPSVKQYQPAGYWAHLNFPEREWQADHGRDQYRRGLYTWWQRTFLQPSLLAFDAPPREECTGERTRANTPQQALALLDDPTYVEAARAFAARIVAEGGADGPARIAWAWRRALARAPTAAELAVVTGILAHHRATYAADPAAAAALAAVGDYRAPATIPAAELAAWTSVARTILNLHETITRN